MPEPTLPSSLRECDAMARQHTELVAAVWKTYQAIVAPLADLHSPPALVDTPATMGEVVQAARDAQSRIAACAPKLAELLAQIDAMFPSSKP
ncbi:MAG: hypothetical protein ACLP66_24280 [Polyangia bacterium]